MPHRRSGPRASVLSSWLLSGPVFGDWLESCCRPDRQLLRRRRGIVGRAGTRRRTFAPSARSAPPSHDHGGRRDIDAPLEVHRIHARGDLIITRARDVVEREAEVRALESGHLPRYAGDVWFPQPEKADHSWRTMPWNGMTSHISETSLSAQARYAARALEILESYFAGYAHPRRMSDRRQRRSRWHCQSLQADVMINLDVGRCGRFGAAGHVPSACHIDGR